MPGSAAERRAPGGRGFRPIAILCALLAGVAPAAADESAGGPDSASGPHPVSAWRFGGALGFVQRISDVDGQLISELDRQGWGDDTFDQVVNGRLIPGHAQAYSDEPFPAGVRLSLDRVFGPRFSLRGEFSLPPDVRVHGHSDINGFLLLDLSSHSFALIPMYGGSLRVGAGPALDFVTTSNAVGSGESTAIPGATLGAEYEAYRWRLLGVGLTAGYHYVPEREFPGVQSLGGQSGFRPEALDLSYAWLGVSFTWTVPDPTPR